MPSAQLALVAKGEAETATPAAATATATAATATEGPQLDIASDGAVTVCVVSHWLCDGEHVLMLASLLRVVAAHGPGGRGGGSADRPGRR